MTKDENISSPDPEDVKQALKRVFDSEQFRNSERMRHFLQYIVIETLEGRADRIKSYSIAIEVFGRSVEFDASQDGVVRSAANRLRSALERANYSNGHAGPIVIRLPKGNYVPVFDAQPLKGRESPRLPNTIDGNASTVSATSDGFFKRGPRLLVAACVVFAALLVLVFYWYSLRPPEPFARSVLLVSKVKDTTRNSATSKLAQGLSEILMGRLASFGGVRIVDYSHSQDPTIADIGQAGPDDDILFLKVTVREQDNKLSLSWRLNDVRSSTVVWASEESLLNFSSDEAANILTTKVLGLEGAIPTLLSNIYSGSNDRRQCLGGSQRLAIIFDPVFLQEARDCLEDLVKDQPTHAEAWGLLTQIYFGLGWKAASFGEDPEPFRRMLDKAAANAVAFGPRLYTTQYALFYTNFQKGRLADFENLARGMLARYGDPRLKIRVGSAFIDIGREDEGAKLVQQGIDEAEILEGFPYYPLAWYRYYKGDYEGVLAMLKRVDVEGNYEVHLLRAIVLTRLKRKEEAAKAVRALHQLRPHYENSLYLDFRFGNVMEHLIDRIADDLRLAGLVVPKP